MKPGSRIYVAGGDTLIGKAIVRQLDSRGFGPVWGRGRDEPDLLDPLAVNDFFERERPEYVFLVAGKSGGITANRTRPAELMDHNLRVVCNVLDSAQRHGVTKLLYLASSCTYPRLCTQPMNPAALLTGPLEPTNEAYALAKIAGMKLCEAYRTQHDAPFYVAIATNFFGPGDHFDPENSHVIAGLIRRMHEAKESRNDQVAIWGTGSAKREFLYVDDLADACLFAMKRHDALAPLNLGGGETVSIGELARCVQTVVGYEGSLVFDASKPDGMPEKVLDSNELLSMGWQPSTEFTEGLEKTYGWFIQQESGE